jgi:hypothetical protein
MGTNPMYIRLDEVHFRTLVAGEIVKATSNDGQDVMILRLWPFGEGYWRLGWEVG